MNKLLDGLKEKANLTTTENGALTHKTSKSYVLDYFAQGSALRNRDEDSMEDTFFKIEDNFEKILKYNTNNFSIISIFSFSML